MSTTITHQNQPLTWREGRRQRAWQLHQQGWKQTLIAQALGVSQGAVSQWLKRATAHGVDVLRAQVPTPLLDRNRDLAKSSAYSWWICSLLELKPLAFGAQCG